MQKHGFMVKILLSFNCERLQLQITTDCDDIHESADVVVLNSYLQKCKYFYFVRIFIQRTGKVKFRISELQTKEKESCVKV